MFIAEPPLLAGTVCMPEKSFQQIVGETLVTEKAFSPKRNLTNYILVERPSGTNAKWNMSF